MKIGYARVGTHEQLHDQQLDSLKTAGCERIHIDTCSGSAPGTERPELQNARACARTGDTLVVWRLDRLGRGLQDLLLQINGLAEREVQFVLLQEDLNTATPAGRLTFHFCASLAEFERDLIRDRTLGIKEICPIVDVGKATLYRYLTPDVQRRGERLLDAAR